MSEAGPTVPGMELLVPVAAFWALVLGLCGTGLISWRRTRPIRAGLAATELALPIAARTSRSTFLAASAGATVALAGAVRVARGPPFPVALTLAAFGIGVAAAGVWARVSEIDVEESGLAVLYAGKRAFRMPWAECRALRPPRWPLGGWRLEAEGGTRVLMPSDLLGNEDLLDLVVLSVGLSFDGRAWRRACLSR